MSKTPESPLAPQSDTTATPDVPRNTALGALEDEALVGESQQPEVTLDDAFDWEGEEDGLMLPAEVIARSAARPPVARGPAPVARGPVARGPGAPNVVAPAVARGADFQAGYSRYVFNVVPFYAADQQPFAPAHLADMQRHIQEAIPWLNGQAQRGAPNVSFALDGVIKAPVRSNRPLAWFHNANPEVLNFFRPYHHLIGDKNIQAYNTPGHQIRWMMNVMANLAGLMTVPIGGRTQAVAVNGEPGKAMALLSRTVALVNFGQSASCDCGTAAWLGCALLSRDSLMAKDGRAAGGDGQPLRPRGAAHRGPAGPGQHEPPPSRNAKNEDNDIMGGAMHQHISGLGIGPSDFAILRKKANTYRSPFSVHSVPLWDVGAGMPDGDTVQLTVQPGVCPPDRVRLTLTLGNGITWWKSLHLYKRDRTGQQPLVEASRTTGARAGRR